jgi:hypothetical protein
MFRRHDSVSVLRQKPIQLGPIDRASPYLCINLSNTRLKYLHFNSTWTVERWWTGMVQYIFRHIKFYKPPKKFFQHNSQLLTNGLKLHISYVHTCEIHTVEPSFTILWFKVFPHAIVFLVGYCVGHTNLSQDTNCQLRFFGVVLSPSNRMPG